MLYLSVSVMLDIVWCVQHISYELIKKKKEDQNLKTKSLDRVRFRLGLTLTPRSIYPHRPTEADLCLPKSYIRVQYIL